jgi:hypothetical protein
VEPTITFDEFNQALAAQLGTFAQEAWRALVADVAPARPDAWMREHGGELLRRVLGVVLEARSERLGVTGRCECGGELAFRQRRRVRLHTVLPGRDVDTRVGYAQCTTCRSGSIPLLRELETDAEGFTPELRELALLAAVIEPYGSATTQLLGRFALVDVCPEKLRALVSEHGEKAEAYLGRTDPRDDEKLVSAQVYVEVDGGMIHVDGDWHECKLATMFRDDQRVEVGKDRHALLEKEVVGVRGPPEELEKLLRPRLDALGTVPKPIACIADGAPWIWNLFARTFPERIEILDWFHCDEHVSLVARELYGDGTDECAKWRAVQLDRLAHDEVDRVLEALRFARKATRAKSKVEALDDLDRYITTHRERMRYGTFRAQGLLIGSGAIEGAMNHVVQQRMKRPGMRWKTAGADHLLALRCVFRSTGHWDDFLSWRAAA